MTDWTWAQAGQIGGVGFALVFLVLIILAVVIWVVGLIVGKIEAGKAEAGDNNDLFEVDDFGQGLNIGASLGLAETFGPLSIAVNGKYRVNGAYDPTTDRERNRGHHTHLSNPLQPSLPVFYRSENIKENEFISTLV